MKNLFERSWQAISSLPHSLRDLTHLLHRLSKSPLSPEKKHSLWQKTTRALLHCRNMKIHSFNNSVQSDSELNQLWKNLASLDSSTLESGIEDYCPSPLSITAHTRGDGAVQTRLISKTYLAEIKRRRPSRMQSSLQTASWSLTVIPPKLRHGCWLGWQDKSMWFNNSPAVKTYIQSLLPKFTTAP